MKKILGCYIFTNAYCYHIKMFREELERVVGDSIRETGPDGISNLLNDVMTIKQGAGGTGGRSFRRRVTSTNCYVCMTDYPM